MHMRTRSVLVHAFAAGLGLACAVASAADAAGSLADALRIIQSKQYVDLTHSFSPMSPV
jgi:hypothetical protein